MKPSDLKKQAKEMVARGEMPSLEEVLDAITSTREKFAPKIEAARRPPGKRQTVNNNSEKPNSAQFVGTISELIEKLAESVELWNTVEKAIFRASLTGKLSSDKSERTQ